MIPFIEKYLQEYISNENFNVEEGADNSVHYIELQKKGSKRSFLLFREYKDDFECYCYSLAIEFNSNDLLNKELLEPGSDYYINEDVFDQESLPPLGKVIFEDDEDSYFLLTYLKAGFNEDNDINKNISNFFNDPIVNDYFQPQNKHWQDVLVCEKEA